MEDFVARAAKLSGISEETTIILLDACVRPHNPVELHVCSPLGFWRAPGCGRLLLERGSAQGQQKCRQLGL